MGSKVDNMNMKNKTFVIAIILIVVAVASVSAASYGNRRSNNASDTQNLGVGRGNANYQGSLATGEEVFAGRALGNEDRGLGMYGNLDADGLCTLTGEAPVLGSRQGGGLRSNTSQGTGRRSR